MWNALGVPLAGGSLIQPSVCVCVCGSGSRDDDDDNNNEINNNNNNNIDSLISTEAEQSQGVRFTARHT